MSRHPGEQAGGEGVLKLGYFRLRYAKVRRLYILRTPLRVAEARVCPGQHSKLMDSLRHGGTN